MRKGWTQEDLAEKLGCKPGTVGNWESQVNGASAKRMAQLAAVLGQSVEYLQGAEPRVIPALSPGITLNETGPNYGHTRMVPVVSFARAGTDDFNYDDLANFIDERIESDSKDPNCFALIVEGDSMEPMFRPGDRIIVEPNEEPRNGDVVVARLSENGGVLFKLYHRSNDGHGCRLTSYNQVYPEIEKPLRDFRFIYPVRSMCRFLRR